MKDNSEKPYHEKNELKKMSPGMLKFIFNLKEEDQKSRRLLVVVPQSSHCGAEETNKAEGLLAQH